MTNRVVATPDFIPGGAVTGCRIAVYSGIQSLSVVVGEENVVYLIARLADTLSLLKRGESDCRPCDTERSENNLPDDEFQQRYSGP